jgi:Putative adhesin
MSDENAVYEGVRHVVIDNLGGGSITIEPVTGEDLVESSIEVADRSFLERVQIRHDHDWLRISFPQQLLGFTNAHLRLGVPDGLSYVIKTGSADISISADIGPSKIVTGSGDVTIRNAVDLDCSTGSGDISVSRVEGRAARLNSGSGKVLVGEAHCPVTAKSGSGDVVVQSLEGSNLRANSGSGDIGITSTRGSVDLRAASGSLSVGITDNLPAWLELNSVSGDVRIGLEPTTQPEPGEPYITVRARTASGDISIYRAYGNDVL